MTGEFLPHLLHPTLHFTFCHEQQCHERRGFLLPGLQWTESNPTKHRNRALPTLHRRRGHPHLAEKQTPRTPHPPQSHPTPAEEGGPLLPPPLTTTTHTTMGVAAGDAGLHQHQLRFRPAGAPAGAWHHTPWWHCVLYDPFERINFHSHAVPGMLLLALGCVAGPLQGSRQQPKQQLSCSEEQPCS